MDKSSVIKKKSIFINIIEENSMMDAKVFYPPSKKEDNSSNYKKVYAKNINTSPITNPISMYPSHYHPKKPKEDSSKN